MENAGEGFNFPEWYRIEQESKKAIERLHSAKDLAFYSENPDPFIRRLAILRAGALGNREAFAMLNNVTEDPLESEQNRMLAGAFMQKINEALNLGYFLPNKYMQAQQAGVCDCGKASLPVTDSQPAIRYEFSKSLIESQLQMDQSFIKLNLDDGEFAFNFQFTTWLKRLGSAFGKNIVLYVKKSAKLMLAILTGIVRALFINLPKDIAKSVEANRAAKKERAGIKEQTARDKEQAAYCNRQAKLAKENAHLNEYAALPVEQSAHAGEHVEHMKERTANTNEHAEIYKEQLIGNEAEMRYKSSNGAKATLGKAPASPIEWPEQARPPLETVRYQRVSPVRYKRCKSYGMPFPAKCGMIVRRFFYILFSPLRFAFRHKAAVFGSLLAVYLLVSLTTPGKAFLNGISPGLSEANGEFIQTIGDYTAKAFQGTLFTDGEMPATAPGASPEAAPVPQKPIRYVVTAPKGLYLRAEPAENGEKIKLMKMSTAVDYMDEKTETGSVTWFKIKLEDGTSGWANSDWLSEANNDG